MFKIFKSLFVMYHLDHDQVHNVPFTARDLILHQVNALGHGLEYAKYIKNI